MKIVEEAGRNFRRNFRGNFRRNFRRNFRGSFRRNFRRNFRGNFRELVGILGYCRYFIFKCLFTYCDANFLFYFGSLVHPPTWNHK